MSDATGTAARAIVLQISRPPASLVGTDGPPVGSVAGAGAGAGEAGRDLAIYVLTLTVMPDDELPFRCRVSARLPVAGPWNVVVGAHVPVTIGPTHDVSLDTAALCALYDADPRTDG